MYAFSSSTALKQYPVSFKMKQGVLQRQGTGIPVTEQVLNYIGKHPMLEMASQEVLGSNVPLVASSSSPDEAIDQGVFQAAETLNAFGVTILINKGMRKIINNTSHTWGKEAGQELTHHQVMWKNFALSAPLFAWLIGVECFTPLLRNMITLKRTQELEFSKITNVKSQKGLQKNEESQKAKEKRLNSDEHQDKVKERMAEYIKLSKRDFSIMLPTAAGLFGVGLLGMKHHWKMPELHLDTPDLLEKLLDKEHSKEAGIKKVLRRATNQFMSNMFGSEKYAQNKGKMDLVKEAILPNGDWTQGSRLLIALVFALPTYIALSAYSRDDVEKTEIVIRALAYVIANVLFPNAIEGFLDKTIKEDTYIRYIGGKKNISLLSSTLAGSILYAILPMFMIRVTRPWRAKKVEEKKALQNQKVAI